MWDIFSSIGVIDRLKQKGSLEHYTKKLHEFQENEADALIDIGLIYYEDEKYDESLFNLKKAAKIYESLNEVEAEAFVLDLIGDVYLSMREMNKALERYQSVFHIYTLTKSPLKDDYLEKIREVEDIKEAIELAEEEKLNKEIEEELSDISDEELIDEEENLIETYDSAPNDCYLSYEKISSNIDAIMKIIKKKYNIKEPTNAEYESGYYQKLIYDAHKEENKEIEVALLQVLSNYLMKENKPFSALQNLKTAFDLSHEGRDKKGEAFSLLLLGVVYYLLGKEKKIYDLFRKSLIIFKEVKYKDGEKIALDIINTLYNEDECLDIQENILA